MREQAYRVIIEEDITAPWYLLGQLEDDVRVHTFARTKADLLRRMEQATRLWFEIPDDQKVLLVVVE